MEVPRPGLVLLPIFLILLVVEAIYYHKRNQDVYTWKDSLANLGVTLGHGVSMAITALFYVPLFGFLYQHAWFQIPMNFWTFGILIVLLDFIYYWFHRASHTNRWLWATHVVHHSSEKFNLSTPFRLGWTNVLSGSWIFWVPMVLLGFHPFAVLVALNLNLLYQFGVHTQSIKKLGVLDQILNTPSNHRVHHSSNGPYLNKNFGGIFILWDRMFGTYQPEENEIPCEFGIVKNIGTSNPIVIAFHEWGIMAKDIWRTRDLRLAFQFAPGNPKSY